MRWKKAPTGRSDRVLFAERSALFAVTGVFAAVLLAVAGSGPATAAGRQQNGRPAVPVSAAVPSRAGDSCSAILGFDRANFSNPTRVNNTFLPLVPGTRFVLDGVTTEGGVSVPHRVVFTVTDLTKVIDGVGTRVVVDRDLRDGQLAEAELAFFAQDNAGNVWTMGEYPEEYEGGQFVGAPSTWIPGQAGAKAGISMLAHPTVGTPRYLQGVAHSAGFMDCAQVFQTGLLACVPVGCFTNVLVTDENSPLDPQSGHQRKFYAPGVGNVLITAVDDPEGENLALSGRSQLGAAALTEVRNQALQLEQRAYQVSKVYQKTPPMSRG